MKKIFAYMAIAAAVTFAASCSQEAAGPDHKGEDAISLSLVYEAPVTKTQTPGEGLENTVTSVEYYFYDVAGNLVYRYYDNKPSMTTDNKYNISLVVGEGVLDNKSYNDFFPNGAACQFFAVFNYPSEIGDDILENVKKKAVSNSFAHNVPDSNGDPHWYVTTDEDVEALKLEKYFVMTGSATLTPNPAGIEGIVDMRRIAAKISFIVNVTESKEVKEGDITEVWTPMLGGNNARIYLSNAVGNALIGGADPTDEAAGTGPIFPETLSQFDYNPDILNFGEGYSATSPFYYTYPLVWEEGEDSEIFCKLIIPWHMKRTEGGVVTYTTERELYYKVLFPEQEIIANNWYVYTINADFLGQEGEEPTITITADKAQVFPWVSTAAVNPVISNAKYLFAEKGVEFPDITYTTGTTISYVASDEVTVVVKDIYQRNLSTKTEEYLIKNGEVQQDVLDARTAKVNTDSEVQEWNQELVEGWISQNKANKVLQLEHQLNSDLLSNNMDATPYYYVVELHLGAEGSSTYDEYVETITIIQYPQVYVVEDPNSNGDQGGKVGIYINGSNSTTTQWYKGSYYENYGYEGVYNLGGANGISTSASNKNPNMYVLTISVSDKYTIGDPRTQDVVMPEFGYQKYIWNRRWVDDGWYDNWAEGAWTENSSVTNHVLTYYHPASSENTSDMIAPKIRIASSYGVCQVGRTSEEGMLRCATYQEDGLPAGRWRLPTFAEIEYLCTLSANQRIPYLFGADPADKNKDGYNADSYYYSANGAVHVNNENKTVELYKGTGDPARAVSRCVYDEWFWGETTKDNRPADKDVFTWGDKNY